MRAIIRVTDLTLRQWEQLESILKPEYHVGENDTRVCVQFEMIPEMGPTLHRQMSVRAFLALLDRLQDVHRVNVAREQG